MGEEGIETWEELDSQYLTSELEAVLENHSPLLHCKGKDFITYFMIKSSLKHVPSAGKHTPVIKKEDGAKL